MRASGVGLVTESYLILLWCYGLYPTRLLCPWDFPGKNTGLVAISFSRGSSGPRDRTWISCVSYLAGWFFATKPHGTPKRRATILSITSKYLRIMKQLDSIESLDTRASEELISLFMWQVRAWKMEQVKDLSKILSKITLAKSFPGPRAPWLWPVQRRYRYYFISIPAGVRSLQLYFDRCCLLSQIVSCG